MSSIIEELMKLSNKAMKHDEVPIGCVIVKDGKIVSKAYNKKNKSHLVIDHAEVIAINKLCKKVKDWRLDDYTLYVTLEPCNMCKEVIKQTRIKKVYYLLTSNFENINKTDTNYELLNNGEECEEYTRKIKTFFTNKR